MGCEEGGWEVRGTTYDINGKEIPESDVGQSHLHYYNGVVWGNCRRGCPPAYLDNKGFCSPACHMGAPRGEFVTCPQTKTVASKSAIS